MLIKTKLSDELVDTRYVANFADITTDRCSELIRAGVIPLKPIRDIKGCKIFFKKSDVHNWLKARPIPQGQIDVLLVRQFLTRPSLAL